MSTGQIILVLILDLIVLINVFFLIFKAWNKLSELQLAMVMIGMIMTVTVLIGFTIAVNTVNEQLKGHICPEYEEVDIKLYKLK